MLVAYPSEEELQFQRGVIRGKWPRLFEAVEGQLRYVDANLASIERRQATKYDLALSAHLARASKTAMGIVVLCEYGFGELAIGALRPLGETMVSAYFMSLDPDARADQFEAYAKLESIETYKYTQTMGWTAEVDVPEHFQDAGWIVAVRAEFPNPVLGWMQMPMNRVIDAIEPCWGEGSNGRAELRQIAATLHLFGNRHSHVGTFDTTAMLSADDGQLVMHLGPGKKWVPQALVNAAWVYGQIFDLWAEHFALPDLDSWRRRWQLLMARMKTIDAAVARGTGRNDRCPCGSGFKFKRCHGDLFGA